MPYTSEWVSNEVAYEIDGVIVFHVYKNNDMGEGRRTYWFTLDEDGCEDDDGAFDVREFPEPPDYAGPRQPTRYLCKPEGWQGTYAEWSASDLHREIKAEWNAYYAAGGEEPLIQARMEHAVRNKLGPFAKLGEAA